MCDWERLDSWVPLDAVATAAACTRDCLTANPHRAANLAHLLSAYNATEGLPNFGGDSLLPYHEAFFQLRSSMALAFHGFYSQAFSSLRTVIELSLLQAAMPQGDQDFILDRLLNSRGADVASRETGHASSVETWAIDGQGVPRWQDMRDRLMSPPGMKEFDNRVHFKSRLNAAFETLNKFVHIRGWRRTGVHLSGGGSELSYSEESLSFFASHAMIATQLSVIALLLGFSEGGVNSENQGFIDASDLFLSTRILQTEDAELLRQMYSRGAA